MPLFGPPNIEKMQAKRDVNGLIKALSHKDDDIKCDAAKALGEIGDPVAVVPLLTLFRATSRPLFRTDIDVWTEIVVALGNIGDVGNPLVVDTLVTAFKESHGEAEHKRVGGALVKFGIGAFLPLIPDIHRYRIEDLLVQIGTPAIAPLLQALGDPKASRFDRTPMAAALAKLNWKPDHSETAALFYIYRDEWDQCASLGSLAVGPLLAALEQFDRHEHNRERLQVVRTLGRIGAQTATSPLIAILNDKYESPDVRKEAALALGKIGTAESVTALIASLQASGDLSQTISQVLAEFGKPVAFGPLVQALQSESEQVRTVAAKGLGKIGDPRAIDPLVECLLQGNCSAEFAEALDQCGWRPASDEIGAAYWMAKDKSKVVRSFFGSGQLKQIKIECWEKCVEIGVPALGPLVRSIDLAQLSDNIASQLVTVILDTLLKIADRETVLSTLLTEVGRGSQNAAKLLDGLGGKPDKVELEAAYWAAKREWNECLAIGQPAIQPLEQALWQSGDQDCLAILEILGQLGWRPEPQGRQAQVGKLVDRLMEMEAYESLPVIGQPALPQVNAQLARWLPAGSTLAVTNLSSEDLTSLHKLETALATIGGPQAITALEQLSRYVAGVHASYLKLHRDSPTHLSYELELIGRQIDKLRGPA